MALNRTRANNAAKVAAPVVISSSYLDSLRKISTAPFSTEHFKEKRTRSAGATGAGKERAATIRLIDEHKHKEEASRVGTSSLAEIEEEERRMKMQETARPILTSIREARVETMSEVQELNHKVAKARVLDSWDKHRAIKSTREKERQQEEAMFAALAREKDMEAIARATENERRRQERERHAALIIAEQLEERAFQRELELEAVELEAEQMRKMREARERAEVMARVAAEEEGKKRREELALANAAAIRRKAERAEEEKRAEAAVLHHMMEKAAAERSRALEAERAKKEKEMMWGKMRAQHQRIIDRRADEDEKRAKAHEEAVILRERARIKADEERKAALMRTVLAERERQMRLKAQLREEEKANEARLLAMVQQRDVDQAHREVVKREEAVHQTEKYKADLEEELRRREEARKLELEVKYQERVALQREEIRRARALEEAKERKIARLRAEGVTEDALRKTGLI